MAKLKVLFGYSILFVGLLEHGIEDFLKYVVNIQNHFIKYQNNILVLYVSRSLLTGQ